jgi:hypothetical protein
MRGFMKQWLLATFTFVAVGHAFAQTPEALPSRLSSTMKAMSNALKTVSAQAANPQKNAESAVLADNFVKLVLHAKDFTPDSVATLPSNQRPDAKAHYDKMLDQTAEVGKNLATAFRANDNAQAAELLKQLLQAKKEGHDHFKD